MHVMNTQRMGILKGLVLLACFSVGVPAFAQVAVSPILIDREAEPRSIITEDITLTNETSHKLNVYATVNEIAVDESGEIKAFVSPSMADRTNTITSWVEITRGRIELEPGQTTTVPLTFRVHPQAQSGDYHVFIGFVAASKRFEAEATAMNGDAKGTIVKLSLDEKKNQLLRISGFFIDRFIVSEGSRTIDIEVENSGDTPVAPSGEVIFYNSLGEEVTSIPVGTGDEVIPPGESRTIKSEVPIDGELGRFKANVRLAYGAGQQAAVFDTAQFYMVPMPMMIAIMVAIFAFSIFVTYLIRRAFYDELHEDDDSNELPLYVRTDREHVKKDHDIHLTKN